MSNNSDSYYSNLSGLNNINANDIECDEITTDYINGIYKTKIDYISTARSDLQNQIDVINNTQQSTLGGGFFSIVGENGGAFSSGGYNFKFGANSTNVNNNGIVIGCDCVLQSWYIRIFATTNVRINIYKNYVDTGKSILAAGSASNIFSNMTSQIAFTDGDILSLRTTTVSNGGNGANVSLFFSTTGVIGPPGATPNFSIGNVNTIAYNDNSPCAVSFNAASTQLNKIMDFNIKQGPQGIQGNQGDIGITPNFSIGTTTTIPYNDNSPTTVLFDNTSTQLNKIFNFSIKQGPQGPTGATGATGATGPRGEKGDKGDQGEQGPQGEKGESGDSSDAAAIAVISANLAALDAVVATNTINITANTTSITALITDVAALDTTVETLTTKTLYQSTGVSLGGSNYTRFNSDVTLNNGVSDVIKLSNSGTSEFANSVQIDNNLTVANTITTDNMNINDSLNTSGNFTHSGTTSILSSNGNKNINFTTGDIGKISANFNSSSLTYRDVGLDISPPLTNTLGLSDLGSLSIRGGTINIGNASQTSTINLNGYVNMSLNGLFNISGGINQFL